MRKSSDGMSAEDLDRLIEEIITDAYGDDEQLWAFHSALDDGIELPCDAFVIGELVSVVEFDYDGNQRRGLVARCRRDGKTALSTGSLRLKSCSRSNRAAVISSRPTANGRDSIPGRNKRPLPLDENASTRLLPQTSI